MKKFILLLLVPFQLNAQLFTKEEIVRWEKQAKQVTIIRDKWGIPHIYGKTDADAVFGLLYAQCEDDFKRVEMNYVEKLGRLAEVNGESSLYDDLLIRMVLDQSAAISDYNRSPAWLKKLCHAFADGVNYYLYKHPDVNPALLTKFQPWWPMLWTDGSIGAINTAGITVSELKQFYSSDSLFTVSQKKEFEFELAGSNGFAFSPSITQSGNAILYINPHVTFYFRPEVHMVSEEGLNAYGAVTWGQFFVYQGFNEHCGWMHTSSSVDAGEAYIEKLTTQNNKLGYVYEGKLRLVWKEKITLRYKTGTGIQSKAFDALYTHHGPIMAKRNGQYLSLRADNRLVSGLMQCWLRTKAKSFKEFKKILDLRGNISNNTVYADVEGNIAYWHGNRIPIRNAKYDWSKPVDGSIASTEWKGLHKINETVHLINPPNGWLQNCNSTPFTSAGDNSPKRENYPTYMAPDGENFRGINAVRVLSGSNQYTIDKVIAAGYDTRLTAFEILIPALVRAYETSNNKIDYGFLSDAINTLKSWDFRSAENSVATTIAVHYGEKLQRTINAIRAGVQGEDFVSRVKEFTNSAKGSDQLNTLSDVLDSLKRKYGSWKIAWGEINRYQRISGDIQNHFDDKAPSLPVGYAASTWGMLPSFVSRIYSGTQKRYGYNGNSFVCAVEFVRKDSAGGKKIKAKSLLTGGQSGNPASKHFFDQGEMYTKGQFKDVLFYKEDVIKNAEKIYHPGE